METSAVERLGDIWKRVGVDIGGHDNLESSSGPCVDEKDEKRG